MTFEQFQFHSHITAGLKEQNFSVPTPIQLQAIPSVLAGDDLLGIAQTGTGKTAAFVLPVLQQLVSGPRRKIRALIIAPTRELAVQIDEVISGLGSRTGLRSVLLFGGTSMNPQLHRLRSGVEIVVACPGRLIDHLNRRTIDLSSVEMLVLDEADQMFDMGFLPAIRKIVSHLPKKRQTLLFSATMPEDIRRLAKQILHNPKSIEIGRVAPPQTIDHSVYSVSSHQKTEFLLKLLKQLPIKSALIFTRTKHRAKKLAIQLESSGHAVTSLQGNLSQNRRTEAMEGFRNGTYKIMVATDIAARGIDVSSISHVINFDIPSTAETYTHRIGRTGRAERTGEAYTLIGEEDGKMVRAIERLLGKPLERRTLSGFTHVKSPEAVSGRKVPEPGTRKGPEHRGSRNRRAVSRSNSGPTHSRNARRRAN